MNGVLVIDKPAGPTSHDIVSAIRDGLRIKKVGHTGTLDPAATGVLPLVIGKATKVARYLTGSSKRYQATVRLGINTNTLDAAGEVVRERRATLGIDASELHGPPSPDLGLVGLAHSGGGIRSATFCLGVLESLAQQGLLRAADYLSTVSGGGYIGSCLNSLLNDPDRRPDGPSFPFSHHLGVEESCISCHQPHGSIHPALLTRQPPLLCQSCHSARGHPSLSFTAGSLPGGNPSPMVLARSCMNCHTQVHWSNHPSGFNLMR